MSYPGSKGIAGLTALAAATPRDPTNHELYRMVLDLCAIVAHLNVAVGALNATLPEGTVKREIAETNVKSTNVLQDLLDKTAKFH